MSGIRRKVIVPSRYHTFYPGGRYSNTAMVVFFADAGFDGIDMSLEEIVKLEDAWQSVLYSTASFASARGLDIPVCHLPYAMPDPDDASLMARFSTEIKLGLRAAAFMKIPVAVIHPIARHSMWCKRVEWFRQNMDFLSPIAAYADKLGVRLAVENMASKREGNPDHLYGSRASEICEIADTLGVGVCWDFGHSLLSGADDGEELLIIGKRLIIAHIHDNDGANDLHAVPFDGVKDWDKSMTALAAIGYSGALDLELKGSAIPRDSEVRSAHAARALSAATRLGRIIDKT